MNDDVVVVIWVKEISLNVRGNDDKMKHRPRNQTLQYHCRKYFCRGQWRREEFPPQFLRKEV